MENTPLAILLDSQKLFTDSFSLLLERYTPIKMHRAFQDPEEFMQFLLTVDPRNTYVFLEYYLDTGNGLTVLTEIQRISRHIKVIFMTEAKKSRVVKMINAYRPNAIINKSGGLETLLETLREIDNGKRYICPILEKILNEGNEVEIGNFTARELDVLNYISDGKTVNETANLMYISKHTVSAHRRSMMRKANCKTASQLITICEAQQIFTRKRK